MGFGAPRHGCDVDLRRPVMVTKADGCARGDCAPRGLRPDDLVGACAQTWCVSQPGRRVAPLLAVNLEPLLPDVASGADGKHSKTSRRLALGLGGWAPAGVGTHRLEITANLLKAPPANRREVLNAAADNPVEMMERFTKGLQRVLSRSKDAADKASIRAPPPRASEHRKLHRS